MPRRRRKADKRKRHVKQPASPQEILTRALNHPVRVKALTILSERTAGPKEISEEIDEPLPNVSYHVGVLAELGLIEITEEEAVRGVVAHFYRAVERPPIDLSVWKSIDPKIRNAAAGYLIEKLVEEVASSLTAGVFDERDDHCVSRTPLLLDEEGWRNVSKIQIEAQERIRAEQAAATERLNGSSAQGIHAIVGMVFFEAPGDAESG